MSGRHPWLRGTHGWHPARLEQLGCTASHMVEPLLAAAPSRVVRQRLGRQVRLAGLLRDDGGQRVGSGTECPRSKPGEPATKA